MGITFSVPMELPCFLKIAPPVAVANHLASCGAVQVCLWSHPCESELRLLPKNLVAALSKHLTLHEKKPHLDYSNIKTSLKNYRPGSRKMVPLVF